MPGKGFSTRRLSSRLNSGGGSMTGLPSERSMTFSAPNCCFMAMPSSNIRLIHDPTSMPFLTLADTDTFDFLSSRFERVEVYLADILRHAPGDALPPGIRLKGSEHGKAPQHEGIERPDVAQLPGPPRAVDEVDIFRAPLQDGGNLVIGGVVLLPQADGKRRLLVAVDDGHPAGPQVRGPPSRLQLLARQETV